MERTMEHPKENKPVKPVKEHWKSGIQSKFLDAALQMSNRQAELAYTKYKKLEMSKKEIVVSQLCYQGRLHWLEYYLSAKLQLYGLISVANVLYILCCGSEAITRQNLFWLHVAKKNEESTEAYLIMMVVVWVLVYETEHLL